MTINRILAVDAATCAIMGLLLVIAASGLSELLGPPEILLTYAGIILLPIALFMALLARRSTPSPAGVWLVVVGNLAWVVGSVAVLAAFEPNGIGIGFVLLQAAVVTILAFAEFTHVRASMQVVR